MKRLVVFSHKLFRQTNQGLQTTGAFTIQIDALSPYFTEVMLCVPVKRELDFCGVNITAPNINFHPLPYYEGKFNFVCAIKVMRNQILEAVEQSDIGLIILPSYVGLLASIVCQVRKFPIFHWVVGDLSRILITRQGTSATRWIANHLAAPMISLTIKRLTRDTLTFYNGKILYDQGKKYHHVRISSSIHVNDIYHQQKNINSPIQVLFVGRLSPEKGVVDLLQAVSIMIARGDDVSLNIVGTGELKNELKQQANHLSISDRINFLDYVPIDKLLKDIYRSCDILVLPSHADQYPKVLLEGMSQGIPIIATNVGGIPSIVKDGVNGLLIPPGQPREIVEACERIVTNNNLQHSLVQNGLAFAREHTIEAETANMMSILKQYFEGV